MHDTNFAFNTLKFFNDQRFIDNDANVYQKKMFNSLVDLERACNRNDRVSGNTKTNEIINIAVNNNDFGLESMRSVVDYFYPRLRDGSLKDAIGRIHETIHHEIKKRERTFTDNKRKTETVSVETKVASKVTPVTNKAAVKAPKKKDTDDFTEIGEDFPVFEDSCFPDTSVDLFSKMLATS